MSRVAVPLIVAVLVAACSSSSTTPSLSLNGGESDGGRFGRNSIASGPASLGANSDSGARVASSERRGRQQTAMLNDRAPKGSFDRAPRGALADRDYSVTVLQPEQARALINAYRHKYGLKPLKLDATLTAAAKGHSQDLAKWDRISHFGSDGSNPWDRVKRAGFHARLAAENVGTGQATFDEVLKGWKDSPGHNKNLLLADATHMGIALVHDRKTEFKTFWTLVLGAPL